MDTVEVTKEQGTQTAPSQGTIVWWDMQFDDLEAAKDFYTELFGWQVIPLEGSDPPYYMILTGEGSPGGGFSGRSDGEPANTGATTCYLYMQVDHMAKSMKRAEELGATLQFGPMEIPMDEGAFSHVIYRDPQNVMFGMVGPTSTRE
jgi:uncharacterized protein